MREDRVKLLRCASSFPSVFSHTLFSVEHQEALQCFSSSLCPFLLCFHFFYKSLTMFIAVIPKHSSASCIHSKPPPFLICALSLSLSAHCIPIPPLLSLQSNQLLLLPTALFSFSLSSSSFFKDKSQPASVRSPSSSDKYLNK